MSGRVRPRDWLTIGLLVVLTALVTVGAAVAAVRFYASQ